MKYEFAGKDKKAIRCCAICGNTRSLHTHHIITRKAYGNDKKGFNQKENCVLLCSFHHLKVHTEGAKTFWAKFNQEIMYQRALGAYYEYERIKNGRERA
jgi:5-methylcytosine-specific restriction endonuclease McrA